MADTNWTKAQQQAIATVGHNLLVSAAAGSGKTSVLAERCAFLVCDAPATHRCEVNELLVVTFTEAAAAEMRARIATALSQRYAKSADDRLARQLVLIDRAQISTLHAFCLSVIRAHFHSLKLDPAFTMLSEEEGVLMRSEIARRLFDDRYAGRDAGAFQRFVDHFGDGSDASLRSRVIHTHNLLASLVRPEQWLKDRRARLEEAAAARDLPQSWLGRQLLDRLGSDLQDLRHRCAAAGTQFDQHAELDKQKDFAGDVLAAIEVWQDALKSGGADGLATAVRDQPKIDMPRLTKPSPQAKALRDEVKAVRDELQAGPIRSLARFTAAEWRDGMRAVVEPAGVLIELVEEFGKRYDKAKHELRVLDFSDLERFALRALSDGAGHPTPAARSYREQFRHVLVDEYQDINELQDAILSTVRAEDRFFCVGDVKQSIYRFRLAEPKRFLDRNETYRTQSAAGRVIDLQTNFRSRAPLLEALNDLFERLMTKESAEIAYDETQFLHPPSQSPYDARPARQPHVELHILPKDMSGPEDDAAEERDTADDCSTEENDELDRTEREAAFVAARIRRIVHDQPIQVLARSASGTPESRPARYGDIAILLRSMRFKSEQFATMLRRAGIPVHSDSATGFFESMEVRDVLALLSVLDNPMQDIPLAAVLRSPIASMPAAEDALARVRLAFPSREVAFHQALPRYAGERDDELAARLRDFLGQLQNWREMAHRRPLAEVLWTIYRQSGYLAFCEGLHDGEQRLANLLSLHERATQFGGFRRQGLGRFLRFLDSLSEESDLGQPSVAGEADDVVRVMSVHRSKGLEFPIVIVPDLGKLHNLSDARGHILVDREAGMGMSVCDDERRVRYPSLASVVVSERVRRQLLAEEMRVLYVATTRAREKLILVGTCRKGVGDELRGTWLRRWSEHNGPLPAAAVLGGSCMLDWIGPAWAATQSKSGASSIELIVHKAADVTSERLAVNDRASREPSARQRSLAALKPLTPAPKQDATADVVWNRLTHPYPFRALTRIRASNSVTAMSKSPATDLANPLGSTIDRLDGLIAARGDALRSPRTGAGELVPGAADVGSATHVLLQRLDFSQPVHRAQIEQTLRLLIDGKQLLEEVARKIDLAGVEWFVQSELGSVLRKHASKLRRELSINFPMDPPRDQTGDATSAQLMDRVMVRGRLDLFLPLDEGGILVDFKTDRLSDGKQIDQRMESYGEQLKAYATAIERIWGRPVTRASVVFLHPRVVRDVKLA